MSLQWRQLAALVALATTAAATTAAPVVLKAARYFDAAAGTLVAPAVVVIEDGQISAVNPPGPPAGATMIDLGELTLLPGLIDAHTHLTEDVASPPPRGASRGAADFALLGARAASRTLQAGFTTVRDLGAPQFADLALARAIEQGWVPGPEMIAAGHGIGISGGHCDGVPAGTPLAEQARYGVADGADEVLQAVRQQIKHGARVIKICITAGVMSVGNSLEAVQMTDAELAAAVAETHRQGLRIAAHAHGAAGVLAAARAGVDSIEHASYVTPEALRIVLEKKITLVPTLYLMTVFDLDRLPERLREPARQLRASAEDGFRRAVAAGARIAFGSDAAVIPHGDNAHEFATRVALGQPPVAALQSATTQAAELLGLADRGLIAAGRRADLIAVRGDPLADIRTLEDVRFVMKQGRVHKDATGPAAARP